MNRAVKPVKSLFQCTTERELLWNLLKRPYNSVFPYKQALDELKQYHNTRPDAANLRRNFSIEPLVPQPSIQVIEYMQQPAQSSNAIQHFLTSSLSDSAAFETSNAAENVCALISACPKPSIPILNEYLQYSWQSNSVSISSARRQAELLLLRAIELNSESKYLNEELVTGIAADEYKQFEVLVKTFFETMDVPVNYSDPLYDLLLRLQAKCGSLNGTIDQFKQFPSNFVSIKTLQTVLNRFKAAKLDRKALEAADLGPALLNQYTHPLSVDFALQFVESQDDFYNLVEWVRRSPHAEQIYEKFPFFNEHGDVTTLPLNSPL